MVHLQLCNTWALYHYSPPTVLCIALRAWYMYPALERDFHVHKSQYIKFLVDICQRWWVMTFERCANQGFRYLYLPTAKLRYNKRLSMSLLHFYLLLRYFEVFLFIQVKLFYGYTLTFAVTRIFPPVCICFLFRLFIFLLWLFVFFSCPCKRITGICCYVHPFRLRIRHVCTSMPEYTYI